MDMFIQILIDEYEIAEAQVNGNKFQYSVWQDDGKGFNEGFVELNFGSGAMMRIPITYQVEAWRPMADIINEYINHGVTTTEPTNDGQQ